MATAEQPTPAQHDGLMMNGFTRPPPSNEGDKLLQGAIGPDALLQELNALKMQLGNNHTTTMAGSGQVGSDGFMNMPAQSSPDSDQGTSSAPYPSQNHTDDVN